MTSQDRREIRYRRRKQQRLEKNMRRAAIYGEIDDILGFHILNKSSKKSRQNVMWKPSVQSYKSNLCINSIKSANQLKSHTWISKGFYEFDIIERGKPRHIESVAFSEKVIQRSFSDNCLIPIIRPHLIYDNGASLKGKGTSFALNRLLYHMRRHYQKYGKIGGIYLFDFKNYFKNIQNIKLKSKVIPLLPDNYSRTLFNDLINAFKDDGLGLGSQVSQISAIFYPNQVDHFIKDKLQIKGYGRYMDDGYIIFHDITELKKIIKLFENFCEANGIKMNKKKCQIT